MMTIYIFQTEMYFYREITGVVGGMFDKKTKLYIRK